MKPEVLRSGFPPWTKRAPRLRSGQAPGGAPRIGRVARPRCPVPPGLLRVPHPSWVCLGGGVLSPCSRSTLAPLPRYARDFACGLGRPQNGSTSTSLRARGCIRSLPCTILGRATRGQQESRLAGRLRCSEDWGVLHPSSLFYAGRRARRTARRASRGSLIGTKYPSGKR